VWVGAGMGLADPADDDPADDDPAGCAPLMSHKAPAVTPPANNTAVTTMAAMIGVRRRGCGAGDGGPQDGYGGGEVWYDTALLGG
jgi:hypothetical protein